MNIRNGEEADLEQINGIYNHYVRTSPATFDIEEISMAQRREWFARFHETGRHRLFVAAESGDILGFATSNPFMPRPAYETSVATTIYCHPDHCGRGIGGSLYAALFDAIGKEDLHRAYGGITMPNDASVALHTKFGFRQAGYFKEQGRKFERYWDVAWFEKEL